MKTTLKILGLLFIIAITITSCETPSDSPKYNTPIHKDPNNSTPIDWTKLHHIRPTKPIRIPDTMAIQTKPAFLKDSYNTIIYNPQDSIPRE